MGDTPATLASWLRELDSRFGASRDAAECLRKMPPAPFTPDDVGLLVSISMPLVSFPVRRRPRRARRRQSRLCCPSMAAAAGGRSTATVAAAEDALIRLARAGHPDLIAPDVFGTNLSAQTGPGGWAMLAPLWHLPAGHPLRGILPADQFYMTTAGPALVLAPVVMGAVSCKHGPMPWYETAVVRDEAWLKRRDQLTKAASRNASSPASPRPSRRSARSPRRSSGSSSSKRR